MSGSNPFRPKKLENSTAPYPHQQHRYHPSSPSPSITPDPIFFASPSAASAPQPNLSSLLAGSATPPAIVVPVIDDSALSDDQSTTDPFHQDSYLSDDEGDQTESEASMTGPTPGRYSYSHLQEPIPTAPLSVSSSSPPFPITTLRGSNLDNANHIDRFPPAEIPRNLHESSSIASSNVSRRSSTSPGDIEQSSTADDSWPSTRTGITARPLSFAAVDGDLRALNSRPGTREKIPPPPPKSHHGKLINSETSKPLPALPTTSSKKSNRLSLPAPSPGLSPSQQTVQPSTDFLTKGEGSQSTHSTESLRRSQSQYKRPPTPPLSRRHSQMRRSKSTAAKPTASRLSMPPAKVEITASPPSSPGLRPITPSRSRDIRFGASVPDDSTTGTPPQSENIPPISVSLPEVPDLAPRPPSKRASLVGPMPPPPPPRRSRGTGNHSSDSSRATSRRPEQRAEGHENIAPHPSHARDILADLTRLQKEVDDLRGHYENQRAS